ncbi:hypothetical protein BsWGS_07042 [Bradybaena similaris]
MLLYVLLILLPAMAHARCNQESMWLLYDRLDENHDNGVHRSESDAFIYQIDVDRDNRITLFEIKMRIHAVAPRLIGHEDDLFQFIDVDGDKYISGSDVDVMYFLIDTDRNYSCSREEYKRFLRFFCPAKKPRPSMEWGRSYVGLLSALYNATL